jgi:hypothetical protein
MAGLLVLLVGGVVVSPTGVSLTIAPAGLPLPVRIVLGVVGLGAACLPPAILTYAWYTARLRVWGEGSEKRIDPELERRLRAEAAQARQLAEGAAQDSMLRARARATVRPGDERE